MHQQRIASLLVARSRSAASEWLCSGVLRSCVSASVSAGATSQAWIRSISTTLSSASEKNAAKPDASKAAADKEASGADKTEVAQSLLFVDLPSTTLSPQHVGNYYQLQPQLIPEAFPEIHQAFLAPRGAGERPRRGGCLALQAEVAAVSCTGRYQQPVVMYREAMHLLMRRVLESKEGAETEGGSRPTRALLKGAHGSGKSIALAALVEHVRAQGWIALYIPSARALVRGGYFTPRTGAPTLAPASASPASAPRTTFDTQISAQHLLLSMRTAHAKQLSELKASTELSGSVLARSAGGGQAKEGATVADVVEAGLATDTDGALAVDAALALIQELTSLPPSVAPVLLAVDDYNNLYGKTAYGRPHAPAAGGDEEGEAYTVATRKVLDVTDLTLASQLRLLAPGMEGALGNAHVVCAVTAGGTESRTPSTPKLGEGAVVLEVPRMSEVEAAHALQHYHECGSNPHPPTFSSVRQVLTLTAGNWEELRRVAGRAALLPMYRNKRVVLNVV